MKKLTSVLLFFVLSFSFAFGQEKSITVSKVTHLGSVSQSSIQLGIDRLLATKQYVVDMGFMFDKGAGQPLKDKAVEIEFVQYELATPVSFSTAVSRLSFMGYRPATFEEAASVNEVSLQKIAGQKICVLGTKLTVDKESVLFYLKYSNSKVPTIEKMGVQFLPEVVRYPGRLEGTIIVPMVRVM